MSGGWPDWYCQVCGCADGENAENCDDCNSYLASLDLDGGEQ